MSIGFRLRQHINWGAVAGRARSASSLPLSRAAAVIRLTARRSIRRRGRRSAPAAPGQPPKTYRGRIRRAIVYAVDRERQNAVIGPDRRIIGRIGHVHEFGGREKRRGSNFKIAIGGHGPIGMRTNKKSGKLGLVVVRLKTAAQVQRAEAVNADYDRHLKSKPPAVFPPRPFMGPALHKQINTIPRHWRGVISQ